MLTFDLLSKASDAIRLTAPTNATVYGLVKIDMSTYSVFRTIMFKALNGSPGYRENEIDGKFLGLEDGSYLLVFGSL